MNDFCTTYYHLKKNHLNNKRFCVNQGGSRSGKTYSILQYLIMLCIEQKDRGGTISIVRKTFPALRATVMRDFFEILNNWGIYNVENHNKSANEYNLFGNLIEFFSTDEEQKLKGRKRDLLYINEANEIDYPIFTQLNMRTTQRVIIDYNPSEEFWTNNLLSERKDDTDFFITTYKDNPFLNTEIVKEIESYKITSPNYLWKIYGLGEFSQKVGLIFTNAIRVYEFPEDCKNVIYGIDFGFTNDPTTILKVGQLEGAIYAKELCYETQMRNTDIIERLKEVGVKRGDLIKADSAEPKSIHEIRSAGFNIVGATKGKDSIQNGIDFLHRYELRFIGENLWKERNNYVWKTNKDGSFTNDPIDNYNHLLDPLRYAVEQYQKGERQELRRFTV